MKQIALYLAIVAVSGLLWAVAGGHIPTPPLETLVGITDVEQAQLRRQQRQAELPWLRHSFGFAPESTGQ
jgi:hypothetical protein